MNTNLIKNIKDFFKKKKSYIRFYSVYPGVKDLFPPVKALHGSSSLFLEVLTLQEASTKATAMNILASSDNKVFLFNQSCAANCGIDCYLYPGEYASISYNDMTGKKYISEKLEFSEVII